MAEEAPPPAPAATAPAAAAPGAKRVRATNCTQCNKRLNRKTQYYRNGKYFCSKRCWKDSTAAKPKEGGGAA